MLDLLNCLVPYIYITHITKPLSRATDVFTFHVLWVFHPRIYGNQTINKPCASPKAIVNTWVSTSCQYGCQHWLMKSRRHPRKVVNVLRRSTFVDFSSNVLLWRITICICHSCLQWIHTRENVKSLETKEITCASSRLVCNKHQFYQENEQL